MHSCPPLHASKSMIAANATKFLHPKAFHVTRVGQLGHLLYHYHMKVKPRFQDVDQLVVNVEAETVKNKTEQENKTYWLTA